MRHFRGILWLATMLGAALLAALAGVAEDRAVAPGPAVAEQLPTPRHARTSSEIPHDLIGSRTCASTACHGSVHADPRSLGLTSTAIRRDEYVFWSDRDPHARSLRTLDNDRSRQMLAELGITSKSDPGYKNCLSCHATSYVDPVTQTVELESVSCEACHGPAEAWRVTHYQRGGRAHALASGMQNTKNLAVRAQQCVQCHVGAEDREVNHDLIAAGHPALKFELAAYHDLLPKHWNDAQERTLNNHFELDLWSAGQQQTIEQSLALLEARLVRQIPSHPQHEQAVSKSPVTPVWPEFAEFDCFACHHDLVEGRWYRPSNKKPSALADWNTWNFAQLSAESSPALIALRESMNTSWRAPEEALLQQVAAVRKEVSSINMRETQVAANAAANHWDSAAQAYLRLAAQFRNRQDAARNSGSAWPQELAIKKQLLELRQHLAFDPQYDSPATDAAGARDAIVTLLRSLEQQLSR